MRAGTAAILLTVVVLACQSGETAPTAGGPSATAPTAVAAGTPPTAQAWPLLSGSPTPCAAYTYPAGPVRAWPTVDPQNLASLANFDPCAVREAKNATALRPTGGPYIGQDAIVARASATDSGQWTKVRAYLLTHAAAQRLVGTDSDGPDVYPDREVWLVVTRGTGCAIPSGKPGAPPEKPRYCWGIYDAADGRPYEAGSSGANSRDWPPFLPDD